MRTKWMAQIMKNMRFFFTQVNQSILTQHKSNHNLLVFLEVFSLISKLFPLTVDGMWTQKFNSKSCCAPSNWKHFTGCLCCVAAAIQYTLSNNHKAINKSVQYEPWVKVQFCSKTADSRFAVLCVQSCKIIIHFSYHTFVILCYSMEEKAKMKKTPNLKVWRHEHHVHKHMLICLICVYVINFNRVSSA